jgi:hypothetical protein
VNFRHCLAALIFLTAGVNPFVEEFAPASGFALPVTSPLDSPGEKDRPPPVPSLVWKTPEVQEAKATVEVIGADPAAVRALAQPEMTIDQWNSILLVRVVPANASRTPDPPPLWGFYRVADDIIRFEPRFPLEPGMSYQAEFDPVRLHDVAQALTPSGRIGIGQPRSTTRLIARYALPKKPAQSTTQVTEIYPSGDLLPENLLRFTIFFSAPMSRGEAYRRIALLDIATGKTVDYPFLELDEELWSPDGTRFTLVCDPGRVKRGLKPREEVGPVLEEGKSYSLVIDRQWVDAAGNLLKTGFRKTFRVGPPDETSPDPKTWTVHSPEGGSRDPLELRFPEPLNRTLLDRLIWVENADAKVVTGQVSVVATETRWRFTPASPWQKGEYRLVVGSELEDLAGNSVAQPFEVDAAGPISRRVTTKTVELPFRIGPLAR